MMYIVAAINNNHDNVRLYCKIGGRENTNLASPLLFFSIKRLFRKITGGWRFFRGVPTFCHSLEGGRPHFAK